MAYGMRKRGRSGSRRVSARPVRRKKAVPVPSRPKRSVRKTGRTNALAINTNRRMIQQLKMSQYGCVQKNFQSSRGNCNPVNGRPVLLDLGDFSKGDPTTSPPTIGGLWYQKDTSGNLQTVNMWTEPPAFFGQNPYWQHVNKDIPNSGKIFACWQKITFKFEGNLRLTDTRIRIDVFRAKTRAFTPNAGITPSLILPGSLGAFGGLAECQNKISQQYFDHKMTRWVRSTANARAPSPRARSTLLCSTGVHEFEPSRRQCRHGSGNHWQQPLRLDLHQDGPRPHSEPHRSRGHSPIRRPGSPGGELGPPQLIPWRAILVSHFGLRPSPRRCPRRRLFSDPHRVLA